MPEILFDIQSNISIDVCLDVLAQNLIDTCRHHHNQLIMNDNNNNNNGNGNGNGNDNVFCFYFNFKNCSFHDYIIQRGMVFYC